MAAKQFFIRFAVTFGVKELARKETQGGGEDYVIPIQPQGEYPWREDDEDDEQ